MSYHINPETGAIGKCDQTPQTCFLSGDDHTCPKNHFSTMQEAVEASSKLLNEQIDGKISPLSVATEKTKQDWDSTLFPAPKKGIGSSTLDYELIIGNKYVEHVSKFGDHDYLPQVFENQIREDLETASRAGYLDDELKYFVETTNHTVKVLVCGVWDDRDLHDYRIDKETGKAVMIPRHNAMLPPHIAARIYSILEDYNFRGNHIGREMLFFEPMVLVASETREQQLIMSEADVNRSASMKRLYENGATDDTLSEDEELREARVRSFRARKREELIRLRNEFILETLSMRAQIEQTADISLAVDDTLWAEAEEYAQETMLPSV